MLVTQVNVYKQIQPPRSIQVIPRTTGNLVGTICSKAVEKSALAVAKDHTLEIPTYIQSMSTKLANNADDQVNTARPTIPEAEFAHTILISTFTSLCRPTCQVDQSHAQCAPFGVGPVQLRMHKCGLRCWSNCVDSQLVLDCDLCHRSTSARQRH